MSNKTLALVAVIVLLAIVVVAKRASCSGSACLLMMNKGASMLLNKEGPKPPNKEGPKPPNKDGSKPPNKYEQKRILFIGNSMTYVGNLPKLISQIATEHGHSLTVDSETPGGTTLAQHFNGKARSTIQTGKYDIVVIQGQSSEAIDDYENFKSYGIKLANEAIKYNAKPFLFSAWSCCTPFACSGEQQEEDYQMIRKAYEDIAKATKATIVPVGKAWQLYRKAHPAKVGELTTDNCHPNQDGAYLSACVFFETIFAGESSVGTSFSGNNVDTTVAKELQATAHTALSSK